MTQLLRARQGEITAEILTVAGQEGIAPEELGQLVARGLVVIPANIRHSNLSPRGIGARLRTKVNANIGTSADYPDIAKELDKLRAALAAGADAVMDLSTGGDLEAVRQRVMAACAVPVGTVPVYQAMVQAQEERGSMVEMTADDLFAVIRRQVEDGVDFITVHCGVTLEAVGRLQKQGRLTDIVSRGGAFLAGWMLFHEQENPLYTQYDRLLEIVREYDVTLSLGDGMRPGCLADATDRAQVQELVILGELVDAAREAGVQVMVEGPGHVPLDQVEANVQLEKSLCRQAPFYVLGPIVTDVAPGYDHLTSAIGGALAAMAGADFLCYVTPAEHLGLPNAADVQEGVVAARIAAHAADVAKGLPGAKEWDRAMAVARKSLDWEEQIRLAIDPQKARQYRESHNPEAKGKACSMCGTYCAMDVVAAYLGKPADRC
ncbi:MAG: phosphomethylpyrimidine synthase ThiC [Clostridia bacterium]|nr:MAG: phosphomethylpyrimidine synthase ThiC [Clostridia bacterium]